tara:strand:- start:800 stop:1258 length:459 start_codon:yes stop_codon:yes gene_type:complete
MAIPRKQIGWGTDSNLLWGIWKALDKLTRVTSKSGGGDASLPFRLISAATTNATSVKASAGKIVTITGLSTNASTVSFLKIYDKATAPVVGTDVPVMTIPIPTHTQGAGIVIPICNGVTFLNGIALAITGAVSDSDTTAVAADEVVINLTYI